MAAELGNSSFPLTLGLLGITLLLFSIFMRLSDISRALNVLAGVE